MIRYLKNLCLPAILCGALAGSALAQLPEGPGKAATMQLCGNCHEATIVQQHRQSRDEWVATIQKMMAAGAEGTEDQFMAVLQYLTKNFGPVAAKIIQCTGAILHRVGEPAKKFRSAADL